MNDILKGLKELTENLKSGKPIEIIKVKREETPDGPMHVRTVKKVRFEKGQ